MAIQTTFTPNFHLAFYWILLGLFLDFFDGFAARLLKVSGELGKQLDSLADMVTFGIAPGLIMYQFLIIIFLQENLYDIDSALIPEYARYYFAENKLLNSPLQYFALIAFLIPILSAVRLAKFNISTNQTDEFIGLPTPANALFFASLPMIFFFSPIMSEWIGNIYFIFIVILFFSYLLNAPIRLIALKFKSFGWKGNEYRFILLGCILLTILGALLINSIFIAIPIIILLYIVISIIKNSLTKI
jgi:CDP-diacylglycerol--serine O-phosphatidyltransferase